MMESINFRAWVTSSSCLTDASDGGLAAVGLGDGLGEADGEGLPAAKTIEPLSRKIGSIRLNMAIARLKPENLR